MQALKLLGPEFHVVETCELAQMRKIDPKSARRIFQRLVPGETNRARGARVPIPLAREVAKDCWAITNTGQHVMGWDQNADAAYREWLYVVCDTLDGAERQAALETLAYIRWPLSAPLEWEELAFHVVASIIGAVEDPNGATLRTVENAILTIRHPDIARRMLALIKDQIPERPHLGQAARHLGRQGSGLGGDLGTSGDVRFENG